MILLFWLQLKVFSQYLARLLLRTRVISKVLHMYDIGIISKTAFQIKLSKSLTKGLVNSTYFSILRATITEIIQ